MTGYLDTVVVYGPEGSGKTLNAESIAKYFGCSEIIDNWDGKLLTPHALHLTNLLFPEIVKNIGPRYEIFSIKEALYLLKPIFNQKKIPAIESNYKEILRLVETLKKDYEKDMINGMRAICEMLTVNSQTIIQLIEEYWTRNEKQES